MTILPSRLAEMRERCEKAVVFWAMRKQKYSCKNFNARVGHRPRAAFSRELSRAEFSLASWCERLEHCTPGSIERLKRELHKLETPK